MSDVVLHVDGLSKQYRIGERKHRYRTARDAVTAATSASLNRLFRRNEQRARPATQEPFWALKDVSFDVRRGDIVGVIGRNGAGKSTLLKVLARITEPTAGLADVKGRVAALLEVGTGFHQELTGRENIQLSGAILGMRRAEIAEKFDAIVEFAEVEKFIDTPLKHYSSGMHLRLAFAVAAHLEPDILLVDEVLAVGDLAFQKKCLGKMEDVAAGGRTVLYVSHMLTSVKRLCRSCLVLENGRVGFYGPVSQGLAHYTNSVSSKFDVDFRLTSGWHDVIVGQRGEPVDGAQPFTVEATFDLSDALPEIRLVCVIEDSSGNGIAHNFIDFKPTGSNGLLPGRYSVRAAFPPLWLVPDAYTLCLKLYGETDDGRTIRRISDRSILDVTDSSGQLDGKVRASLIPPVKWSIDPMSVGEAAPSLVAAISDSTR